MKNNSVCKPEVFSLIYKSNAKDLRNYLYYKYGNLETAEDVVQESFIKLWKNCVKIIFNKARPYLFTIANNLFIDKKRHEKVVLNYQMQFKSGEEFQSPDFLLEEKEFLVTLQKTIGSLPDKQREVFLLNRIDKKTYKEISEMLEISVKTVEKRMHNALKIVREKIGNI